MTYEGGQYYSFGIALSKYSEHLMPELPRTASLDLKKKWHQKATQVATVLVYCFFPDFQFYADFRCIDQGTGLGATGHTTIDLAMQRPTSAPGNVLSWMPPGDRGANQTAWQFRMHPDSWNGSIGEWRRNQRINRTEGTVNISTWVLKYDYGCE